MYIKVHPIPYFHNNEQFNNKEQEKKKEQKEKKINNIHIKNS